MNWLFIHQNFPGQFVHIVRHLVAVGETVCFITQERTNQIAGVSKIVYAPARHRSTVHPIVSDFEGAVENGLAVLGVCEALKRDGFHPDLVVGHNGWGEILYVKQCWPAVPLVGYFEFFYRGSASDLDFDPEFPPSAADRMRVRTRNSINFLGLAEADAGITPTRWQRDLYPEPYRDRIHVLHEGVDTTALRPGTATRLWLGGGLSLAREDGLVTYSARNLEPYRGFHVFMRALPRVLDRYPKARVLIVGGNGVSYGRRPTKAPTWREQLLGELEGRLDTSRIHFLGHLTFQQYVAVLGLSAVHVYLTYPFVLSWSLIEAMAAGCLVLGSRTGPVEEVISDGVNGRLVDFFDSESLADHIAAAIADPQGGASLREAARQIAIDRFDLKTVALPAQLALFRRLIGASRRRRARATARADSPT